MSVAAVFSLPGYCAPIGSRRRASHAAEADAAAAGSARVLSPPLCTKRVERVDVSEGVVTTREQDLRGAAILFSLPDSHYPILFSLPDSHYQVLFSLPDLLFSILLRLACPETVRDGEDGPLRSSSGISGLWNQFCRLYGAKEQQINQFLVWLLEVSPRPHRSIERAYAFSPCLSPLCSRCRATAPRSDYEEEPAMTRRPTQQLRDQRAGSPLPCAQTSRC